MENTNDWVADIAAMHTKFGVNPIIRGLDADKLRMFLKFRLDFLREELVEAYTAAGYTVKFDVQTQQPAKPEDAEHVVDAMIDLCVVAIGTMNAFDVDAYEAWNRVHSANMTKQPGIKASRPNPLGLPDLIKPEGWVSPHHRDNVGLLETAFTMPDPVQKMIDLFAHQRDRAVPSNGDYLGTTPKETALRQIAYSHPSLSPEDVETILEARIVEQHAHRGERLYYFLEYPKEYKENSVHNSPLNINAVKIWENDVPALATTHRIMTSMDQCTGMPKLQKI